MGQNQESLQAIKNTSMQSVMLSVGNEAREGVWGGGGGAHTHCLLCYKQSDNTLVVLHLHLMSVQAARYANVTWM